MRLVGEKVAIRPIERADLPVVLPWWNDPEVMYYADDNPHPSTTLQELEERYEQEERSDSTERFIIETLDGESIGDLVYFGYRPDTRNVQIGILIGVKKYWGRGYGSEAIRLWLKYLFEHRHVHKVSLTVSDFNLRAIRAYEKCGFRRDGVLRHNAIIDGKYVDHLVMSLLEDEYARLYDRGSGIPSESPSGRGA